MRWIYDVKPLPIQDYVGKWGVCLTNPSIVQKYVHPDDRDQFRIVPDHLVYCLGATEDNYLIVAYKNLKRGIDQNYRVKPDIFSYLSYEVIPIGTRVRVKTAPDVDAFIMYIEWHNKQNKEMYFLNVDGRKSKRRYLRDDIEPIEGDSSVNFAGKAEQTDDKAKTKIAESRSIEKYIGKWGLCPIHIDDIKRSTHPDEQDFISFRAHHPIYCSGTTKGGYLVLEFKDLRYGISGKA